MGKSKKNVGWFPSGDVSKWWSEKRVSAKKSCATNSPSMWDLQPQDTQLAAPPLRSVKFRSSNSGTGQFSLQYWKVEKNKEKWRKVKKSEEKCRKVKKSEETRGKVKVKKNEEEWRKNTTKQRFLSTCHLRGLMHTLDKKWIVRAIGWELNPEKPTI